MKQLWGCLKINFTHLRRRKIIVILGVLALLLILVLGYFVLPFMNLLSSGTAELIPQFKDVVPEVYGYVLKFLLVMTAVIALVSMSDSLRERSLKMIVTRPCPIETWVASHFLLGLGVIFTGMTLLTFAVKMLFQAYELPFTVYWWIVTVDHCLTAVSLFSFVAVLSLFVRPVVGALLAGVLNANVLGYVLEGLASLPYSSMGAVTRVITSTIYYVSFLLYLVAPYYFPYQRSEIQYFNIWEEPLRTTENWNLLWWHGGYALLVAVVCYCLICLILHYRNKA